MTKTIYIFVFDKHDLANNYEKGHFLFLQGFSNSPSDVLLTFYHRNYLLGSCDFILVIDIKVQKTHDTGCPNQNFGC